MTNQPATPTPYPALRTHHHHVLTVRSTLPIGARHGDRGARSALLAHRQFLARHSGMPLRSQ